MLHPALTVFSRPEFSWYHLQQSVLNTHKNSPLSEKNKQTPTPWNTKKRMFTLVIQNHSAAPRKGRLHFSRWRQLLRVATRPYSKGHDVTNKLRTYKTNGGVFFWFRAVYDTNVKQDSKCTLRPPPGPVFASDGVVHQLVKTVDTLGLFITATFAAFGSNYLIIRGGGWKMILCQIIFSLRKEGQV